MPGQKGSGGSADDTVQVVSGFQVLGFQTMVTIKRDPIPLRRIVLRTRAKIPGSSPDICISVFSIC